MSRRIAVAMTVIAGLGLPMPASAQDEGIAPHLSSTPKKAYTQVVLRIPGPCPECRFTVRNGQNGSALATKTKTTPGDLTFRVLTKKTRRMSITFSNSTTADTNALSMVTFRFKGLDVGYEPAEEEVLPDRASGCWTGTAKRRVVLPLVLADNGDGLGAWVLKQQSVQPIWHVSDSGVSLTQEPAAACTPSYSQP